MDFLIFITCIVKLAHIPLYLYPFLNTTSKTRPFEYLRLTSLGVIGALVKVNQ
jgi:CCR4-NOT transcription complex subunit 9